MGAPRTGSRRRMRPGIPAATVALVALVALAVAAARWRTPLGAPLPPSAEGPCTLRATVEPAGTVIDPSVSAGVYALPPTGEVRYRVSIGTGQPDRSRPVQGSLRLDLPPPLPDATLARWDDPASLTATEGARTYGLMGAWAPVGATVRLLTEHREPDVACRGALVVRLDGPALGSLLRPMAVAVVVVAGWAMARCGVRHRPRRNPWAPAGPARGRPAGRPGLGALAGLLEGVAVAAVLVLTGAVELGSGWVSACPVLGGALGAALGWWAPLGPAGTGPGPAEDDEQPGELVLLDPQ